MTDEYVGNERVLGRWQRRMFEPCEMAHAFMALLSRPGEETDDGMFELMVDPVDEDGIEVTWRQVKFILAVVHLLWSAESPLRF